MTTIHVNNTTKKTPCQPQSVHSLGMLKHATENITLPQLRDFRLRTRCKRDLCYFGMHDASGQELVVVKFSQQCYLERLAWPCRLHLQGQQSKVKALHSTETFVTLHQSAPVSERHVSQNRRPCQAKLLCMTRLLRICEYHCRIDKSPILDLHFSFRAL